MNPKLCLIEDDPILSESLHDRLLLEGFDCDWHRSGAAALASIGNQVYAAVISDIRLPDLSGEQLFRDAIAQRRHTPPFVFVTAYGSIDRAVELLKLGAADYVTNPFDVEQLTAKLRVLAKMPERTAPSELRPELGISDAMRRLEELLPRVSERADTVLVTGESGVGKERVAQMLHRFGDPEGRAPFIAVNCAALSESLLEAELFGHERDAFTGAIRSRRGVFEQAEGGTLFLDEVGEMTPAMQAKLLRAIQEREIVRVGGEKRIPVHLRLACATNRDLQAMVDAGRFRRDLFYRINVIHLRLPPLRERRDDILWFAHAFLAEKSPGAPSSSRPTCSRRRAASPRSLHMATRRSGSIFLETLERHGWQIGTSAEALAISRKSLWERMRRLGVAAPEELDVREGDG